MAKASIEIVCSECGKTFKHERRDLRNRKDADDYEEWAKRNIVLCPECYAKARREEEQKRIEEATKEVSFASLEGSEKQIAWAEKIRAKFVADMMRYDPLPTFFEMVNAKTKASWWIDNRNNFEYDMIKLLSV